jgi:hypothetical protein
MGFSALGGAWRIFRDLGGASELLEELGGVRAPEVYDGF